MFVRMRSRDNGKIKSDPWSPVTLILPRTFMHPISHHCFFSSSILKKVVCERCSQSFVSKYILFMSTNRTYLNCL